MRSELVKHWSQHFTNSTIKQKLAYAGHVLTGYTGSNTLLLLEGKFDGKKARERPRRT